MNGVLGAKPGTPPIKFIHCDAGQIVGDTDFVYVCTTPNPLEASGLPAY
jgi:hypothetical protein